MKTIILASMLALALASPTASANPIEEAIERISGCIEAGNFAGAYGGLMHFDHIITAPTGTTVEQREPPLFGYAYESFVYACGIDVNDQIIYACEISVEEGSSFVITPDLSTLTYKGAIVFLGNGNCGPDGFSFDATTPLPCDDEPCTSWQIHASGETLLGVGI